MSENHPDFENLKAIFAYDSTYPYAINKGYQDGLKAGRAERDAAVEKLHQQINNICDEYDKRIADLKAKHNLALKKAEEVSSADMYKLGYKAGRAYRILERGPAPYSWKLTLEERVANLETVVHEFVQKG